MKRATLGGLTLLLAALGGSRVAGAHCEVPCGIYTDQLRFEAMLEDATTIHRAMGQIQALAGKTDAESVNQVVRWVHTKEDHATKTQHVIAQYFMTQRIKPGADDYVAKLTAAHAVMQQAMKCKQTTEQAAADDLKAKIMAFHKAYEAKGK